MREPFLSMILFIKFILEETVGSKMEPKRKSNPNCDMLVYEREALIALQTCEMSLTKPVALPEERIVRVRSLKLL